MDDLWEVAETCGVCGERSWRPEFTIQGHRYGRCTGCGVVRLLDRVRAERLAVLYDGYYADTAPPAAALDRALDNPTFATRRRRIEALLEGLPKRIFEIGCGDGNFLALLQRTGWSVSGSEFGDTAAVTRRRHRIPVGPFDILAGPPPGAPFSVIAAYHVLEHIYRPDDWVRAARALLVPGGLLHLQVPNYDSLTRVLTRGSWASWQFPQHVFFYTPTTLTALLARAGFHIETVSTWDPWHGPGTAAISLVHLLRGLTGGGEPWQPRGAPAPQPVVPRSSRSAVRSVARGALESGSYAWSRLEAAAGRGAVVDVVARIHKGS